MCPRKKVYENSARLTMEHRRPQVWERTDRCHFPLPSKYQKRCAKSSTLLEPSKWLHNPETDCQDALPAFAWDCPSLIWSLPCSAAAAGAGTCARSQAQTPALLPSPEARPARARGAACCSGARWPRAPGHHPGHTSPGEASSPTARQDASFPSAGPGPHQCQLQLRVMCKMSTSFLKSATGKCKNLRAAV